MTKTIAYLRVSTDKQADKGISLEAQQDKAKALSLIHISEPTRPY